MPRFFPRGEERVVAARKRSEITPDEQRNFQHRPSSGYTRSYYDAYWTLGTNWACVSFVSRRCTIACQRGLDNAEGEHKIIRPERRHAVVVAVVGAAGLSGRSGLGFSVVGLSERAAAARRRRRRAARAPRPRLLVRADRRQHLAPLLDGAPVRRRGARAVLALDRAPVVPRNDVRAPIPILKNAPPPAVKRNDLRSILGNASSSSSLRDTARNHRTERPPRAPSAAERGVLRTSAASTGCRCGRRRPRARRSPTRRRRAPRSPSRDEERDERSWGRRRRGCGLEGRNACAKVQSIEMSDGGGSIASKWG